MALSTPIKWMTASDLKKQCLEDIELQCIDAGVDAPPLNKGTHWDLTTTKDGNVGSILIYNQQLLDADSDPTRAEGAALEEFRIRIGLPEVTPSVASGELTATIQGTGTIPVDLQFTAPNGYRGKTLVSVTGTGIVSVSAEMLDTGEDGNIDTGTKVKFAAPPANVLVDATVSSAFTGGTSEETDSAKRERIINRLRNPPGGGNWSQVSEIVMSASGAVAGAFCYPALGGPGSMKVVVTSGSDVTNRELTSTTEMNRIAAAIAAEFPDDCDKYVVQSADNLPVSVAVGLQLPSAGAGAWLSAGPINPCIVTSIPSTLVLGPLIPGQAITGITVGSKVAYWSKTAARFYEATVTAVAYSSSVLAGIAVSTWSDGGTGPVVGDYISPSTDALQTIGAAWVAAMLAMGPGENIASTNPRFNRAYRHPEPSVSSPYSLTNTQLSAVQVAVPAITGFEYLSRSPVSTPTVPALLADAPYVLTPENFGIYPL
jgi:hypothetical protein